MTISLKVSGVGKTQGTAVADVREKWCVCVYLNVCVCVLPVAGGKFISPRWPKLTVTGDFGAI